MGSYSKKINFRLDTSLASLFDEKARSSGLSKAEYIRQWVNDASISFRINELEPTGQTTSYSFLLDSETFDRINELASKYGLTTGAFLRLLIQSKLAISRSVSTKLPLHRMLWQKGRLKDVISVLEADVKLKDENLSLLANAYLGLGKFSDAEDVIDRLTNEGVADRSGNSYAWILSAKAEMFRYRLDTGKSKFYLDSAIKIALSSADRGLLGKIYYQLGMLSYMSDDLRQAIQLFLKSLDYLDLKSYPLQIAVTYIYLARLQEQLLNYLLAEEYFKRAEDILLSVDNAYYLGWYFNAMGMHNAIRGRFDEAESLINKSLKYNTVSGSEMESHYSCKYLGILNLAKGDLDSAYSYLSKADEKEQVFRPGIVNSRNQLMKLVVESKSNYRSSISRMEGLLSPHVGQVKPTLGKYLLGSAKYINGDTSQEKTKGSSILTKLANESSGLLKEAAMHTLETKRLTVIR